MKITGGIAAAILLLAGCSSSGSGFTGYTATTHHIIYDLTGTAKTADLTLQLSSGGQSQQQGVDVPLMNKSGTHGLRFTASDGDFLYLSAQNDGSGSLTCKISEDGAVVATNTSNGEYAIVTCQGDA